MSPTLEEMRFERRRSLRWMDQASSTAMVLWMLTAAIASVGIVYALIAASHDDSLSPGWYRHLTLAVWLCLLPIPAHAWAALQVQRQVSLGRVAPLKALNHATRAFWRTLGITAALAVLPLAAVAALAPPPGGTAAFLAFIAALVTGTLGLGILASAAWRGQLRAVWILPGLAALVGMTVWVIPEPHWSRWQAAEGQRAAVLVAMLLLPAAVFAAVKHSVQGPAMGRLRVDVPGVALRTRVTQRLRSITERLHYVDGASSVGMLAGLWGQLPQQFINRQTEGLLFLPWGSTFTLAGPWRLLVLTFVASALLSTPALHWRHLLAPRGVLRSRLGWQIWLTTYGMVVGLLAVVLAPIGLGVLLLSSDGSQLWARVPGLLLSYLPPLLLDLALASALAALIRGWAGTQGRALATLGLLALVWGAVHLSIYAATGQGAMVLLRRDATYAGLIATAAACCAGAAALAWRRADLGALMRSSRRKPGRAGDDC